MSNIDQLTVISTDGASQLSKNVASGFTEVDAVLNSTMGVGIKDLLGGLIGGTAAGTALAKAQSGDGYVPAQVPVSVHADTVHTDSAHTDAVPTDAV